MSKGKELSFDETAKILAWCKGDLNTLYYSSDAIQSAMRLSTFKRIIENRIGTKNNINIIRELLISDFTNKTNDSDHFKHVLRLLYEFKLDNSIFNFDRIVKYCQTNKLGDFA